MGFTILIYYVDADEKLADMTRLTLGGSDENGHTERPEDRNSSGAAGTGLDTVTWAPNTLFEIPLPCQSLGR